MPFQGTDKEKLDTVKNICYWSNKSKRRTIERQVIQAILNESCLKNEIKSFGVKYGLNQGTGADAQQDPLDAIELSHGRTIKLKENKPPQKQNTTISNRANFILSNDNVASVAWGTKKVELQSKGDSLLLKLTMKGTIKAIYFWYKDFVSNDDENIKLATLYKVCEVLTSSNQGTLILIDYVTSMLIHETCETLHDIINKAVMSKHRDEFND